MDPVQVLIVVGFILFSLLQLLAERRGGGGQPPSLPPPHDYGEEGQRPLGGAAEPEAEAEVPWSPEPEDWVPDEVDALADREVVDEEEAAALTARQREMTAERVPETVRVSAPVVSLEPLVLDRVAEHQRFHRRVAPPVAPAPPRSATPSLATGLRSPGALRRAVVLAEVLGPPRSLRE